MCQEGTYFDNHCKQWTLTVFLIFVNFSVYLLNRTTLLSDNDNERDLNLPEKFVIISPGASKTRQT